MNKHRSHVNKLRTDEKEKKGKNFNTRMITCKATKSHPYILYCCAKYKRHFPTEYGPFLRSAH